MITPPSANSPRYSSHLLHQRRWRASAFINSVTSITHKNPNGTQIVQHSYTYDETNNIVEYLNSIDGQTSYDYDFLGQLISADHANQTDESYIYDSNGNRITANGATYTTGTNNELTSDGNYTYTYDTEGNRISKTNTANTERELYTWDYRNRLTSVTKQTFNTETQMWETVQVIEYTYDYNNVWIRKVVGDSKTIFIPENYQTAVQIDNGTVTHHYLWTPNQQDKLLADTTTDGVLWSLTDHLGTVRDILGTASTHLIYDAFGNLISGTNPLLFGFTGKAFDVSTNLQNNINRWYDAAIGRWLSTDPIGFEGSDMNLYRYINNKIVIHLDLLGLESNDCKCPPTRQECEAVLEQLHHTLKQMMIYVGSGSDHSLVDALSTVKVWATAAGYRSEELKKQPCFFQQAVEELESSWVLSATSMLIWTEIIVDDTFFSNPSLNKGWGDKWMWMEIWRTNMLIKRVEVLCRDAQ